MSARQFYIVMAISVIAMKMQKLPCLVANELGKDAWLVFLLFTLVNIIGILLVFFIFRRIELKNVLKPSKNIFFNIFRTILLFATLLYFLVQSILLYEHIQALFSNTLFDDLSWSFFSLLLLFTVFFLAHRGLENIALNYELYTWIIVVPLVILAIFGTSQTNFSAILPLETINFTSVLSKVEMFNCWFGDFFLILYLGIKARDIKLTKTLTIYSISMLFVTFLVVVFTGIYGVVAPSAPGLISVISEQSLLDMSIGRLDWFLILFAEMGAILTCSIYLYFSNLCLHSIFPKARSFYLKIFNIAVLYILDIFILVDLNAKVRFFCGFMSKLSIIVEIFTMLVLICLSIFYNSKNRQGFNQENISTKRVFKRQRGFNNKKISASKREVES